MRVVSRATGAERVIGDGRAVDLRDEDLPADVVRAAIRGEADAPLTIDCTTPSRWWRVLGAPGNGSAPLDRLVAAARSRGDRPPEVRALAAAQRELREWSVEEVDTAPTRRRLADAGAEVGRLREAVATARGRLQGRREIGADTTDAESALADATKRLSEAETERVAAEQAHAAAERRARRAREQRERRLRLQDRVANRRRDARRALAIGVSEAFDAAADAVPGRATLSTDPLGVDGDAVTAALAATRIADLRAPIVEAIGRFDSASAAAEMLDSPVVLV